MVFKNQARGTEDKRKKEFVNVRVFDGLATLAPLTELTMAVGPVAF